MMKKSTIRSITFFISLAVVFSSLAVTAAEQPATRSQDWQQYVTSEEAGFSAEKLEAARKYADNLGSAAIMVIYKGRVLAAWGNVTRKFMCHSMRKSFLSGMYGIFVADGTIDIDKTVGDLGIDDIHPLTDVEKSATVRDMLKARSGIYHSAAYETAGMKAARPARSSHDPNTFWYYNNWDFNVSGHIFKTQTGLDLFEAFKTYIADPIGMQDYKPSDCYYHLEIENSQFPAYPFRMTARDAARFGQLFLQEGKWGDRQVIPEEWIRESTASYSEAEGRYEGGGYAYMWWVFPTNFSHIAGFYELGKYHFYGAHGAGGHTIYVVPGADVVFVHRVDTDRRMRVPYLQAMKVLDMVLDSKSGEAKPEPQLAALKATPFSKTSDAPPIPDEIKIEPAILNDYVGTYQAELEQNGTMTIGLNGEYLEAKMRGEGQALLYPMAKDRFFLKVALIQISFQRNDDGKVNQMTFHTLGGDQVMKKTD